MEQVVLLKSMEGSRTCAYGHCRGDNTVGFYGGLWRVTVLARINSLWLNLLTYEYRDESTLLNSKEIFVE